MDANLKPKPRHPMFEVEDLETRQNYTFKLTDYCIEIYDSSRGHPPTLMAMIGSIKEDDTPPREEYERLYQKSLILPPIDNICFLGYVDENFQPIEQDFDEGTSTL